MSASKAMGVALAATLLLPTSALALTITNRDAKPYAVTIEHGSEEDEAAVFAATTVDAECEDACVVSLAGSENEIEAQEDDQHFVQDGALQRE